MWKLPGVFKAGLKEVENRLLALMKTAEPLSQHIHEYLCQEGGKRIRPLLVLLSTDLLGEEQTSLIWDWASMVEAIHTATLLHDDVADGAWLRRKRPSANRLWNNAACVLTGDYLLAQCMIQMQPWPLEARLKIAEGLGDLSAGELAQMALEGQSHAREEEYFDVIAKKTASLFRVAFGVTGVLLGCLDRVVELEQMGVDLGYCFQLMDDVLDYEGSESTIGKPAGSDLREGKPTLPFIHAYHQASKEDKQWLANSLTQETQTDEHLLAVCERIEYYGGFSYTRERALYHGDRAKKTLESFAGSRYHDLFIELIDRLCSRLS